jgi:hypothetical protein
METHNIFVMVLVYGTANGSWYTKDSRAVTPGRPTSILGNFFGLIRVCFVFEKVGNDFYALSAKKGPFLVEAILRLETSVLKT